MTPELAPADRLLVALDVGELRAAEALLDRLEGVVTGCKIGSELFVAAGPAAVEAAVRRGFRVFLDLKFHDIPNTVAGAVRTATGLGVFMLNVHASGGLAMMRAAAQAAAATARSAHRPAPLVLGVTVLTSLDRHALEREVGVATTVESHVLALAERAALAGLDGCVASPREIGLLRSALGRRFVIVTPGIRPSVRRPHAPGDGTDDQARTSTPAEAIAAGADYLVVGRPVTGAVDPAAAARAILLAMAVPARPATSPS